MFDPDHEKTSLNPPPFRENKKRRLQNLFFPRSYIIPGGSGGHFKRDDGKTTYDVGASMMFGLGRQGTTNLITRALAAVGKRVETVPDPTQIHYHLPSSPQHPQGLEVKVWRKYEDFVDELKAVFTKESTSKGLERFYDECWRVFNSLNSLELRSLEEPRYLLGEFAKHPLACLTLASFLPTNAGDLSNKWIDDEEARRFVDVECFCWSTVSAAMTPMINAGMVFCDRHYGGINYPVGGTGVLAELLAEGVEERGGVVEYGCRVTGIETGSTPPSSSSSEVSSSTSPPSLSSPQPRAVGVRTADGRTLRARSIISNATRWDTFGRLLPEAQVPKEEVEFRGRYKKSPSFLSIHMRVDAETLLRGHREGLGGKRRRGAHAKNAELDDDELQCHHIVLEDWERMEDPRGTLFVSIPSLLDPSLCPQGSHVFHAFTPDWVDAWTSLGAEEYEREKERVADEVVARLEAAAFPRLRESIISREVGTPKTHRRFLNRADGSYGPIPARRPTGMLGMPMNTTAVPGLYCVGDSTFPGQGVNAVVFSGFGCAHRVLADTGKLPVVPVLDGAFRWALDAVRGAV